MDTITMPGFYVCRGCRDPFPQEDVTLDEGGFPVCPECSPFEVVR